MSAGRAGGWLGDGDETSQRVERTRRPATDRLQLHTGRQDLLRCEFGDACLGAVAGGLEEESLDPVEAVPCEQRSEDQMVSIV